MAILSSPHSFSPHSEQGDGSAEQFVFQVAATGGDPATVAILSSPRLFSSLPEQGVGSVGHISSQAAATGGDPAASAILSSPHLFSSLPEQGVGSVGHISFQAAATGGDPAADAILSSPRLFSSLPEQGVGLAEQISFQAAATGGDPAADAILASPHAPSQAAATGGDPAAGVYSSPHLCAVVPSRGGAAAVCNISLPLPLPLTRADVDALFLEVAALWPGFGGLRAAASAPKRTRLRTAIGALVSEARVIFGSALLAARGTADLRLPASRGSAPAVHAWACFLLLEGHRLLRSLWHWSDDQRALLLAQLALLVNPVPWTPSSTPPAATLLDLLSFEGPAREFPAVFCPFFHALAAGCPWDTALRAFASLPSGFFSADGRVFACRALQTGDPDRLLCFSVHPADAAEQLSLFFRGPSLVAVACSHSLLPQSYIPSARHMVFSHRLGRGSFPTRFMPDFIRLKRDASGRPVFPKRFVTSLVAARHEWHRILGPLDAVTAAIVDGKLVMPKPKFPLRPSWRKNHASWENNHEARRALGPKFAAWMCQCIVEIVPPGCPLPLFIEPLGAVDKATDPFWRLILDARLSNEHHDEWGVWYLSVSALAALLDHCDVMFAEDLEDAYHLSAFAGCTGELRWSRVLTFDEQGSLVWAWRLVLGCDPTTCLGFCDKAMSGFCIDGFVARFAAAHFGQRNAGSPLNAFMRAVLRYLASRHSAADAAKGLRRGLGPRALHSAVWVDDTVFVTKTVPHPPCAGLGGGCPVCRASARRAARSQTGWHRLAERLGLGLSDDKRQLPSQRVVYTGLVVDTFLRTLSMPPEKKRKLVDALVSFLDKRAASLSELASLRGRLRHYSVCLPYTLPFLALFSVVIGSDLEPDYDRVVDIPPALTDSVFFLRGVVEEFADPGVPLWPFVPSTLYAAFLAGETGAARIVVITWDSSVHGWGMVLRWWDNREGKVVVGTLPPSSDMEHQVRREMLGGCLAFEATERLLDLRQATVIFRNDALGALSAMRKGSFSSPFLQHWAMWLARRQHAARCAPLYLHAPGRVLVDEGVDDSSRSLAAEVAGPVSGPELRRRVWAVAEECGWHITVDVFASAENALTPRFFARFAEPLAEAEDAFTVGDWACSLCPACGGWHREVLYAYPPPALISRFLAKARADGVRALVVVPLSVSSPYWNKLLAASVLPGAQGYVAVRHRQQAASGSDAAGELAIFPVDFWGAKSRLRGDNCVPRCGKEAAFRGRPRLGSVEDQADRERILSALRSQLRARDV